jgi:hypothetical protein
MVHEGIEEPRDGPSEPDFDVIGPWSQIKLEIVRDYAVAYSTILSAQKNPSFHHVYIDAFAGPGVHVDRETGEFVAGSPTNALLVRPPFREFYFIDLDGDKVDWLRQSVGARDDVHIQRARRVLDDAKQAGLFGAPKQVETADDSEFPGGYLWRGPNLLGYPVEGLTEEQNRCRAVLKQYLDCLTAKGDSTKGAERIKTCDEALEIRESASKGLCRPGRERLPGRVFWYCARSHRRARLVSKRRALCVPA